MPQNQSSNQILRKRKLADTIGTVGLWIAGGLGILVPLLVSIISLLKTNIPLLSSLNVTYNPSILTLIVVSTLAIAIGLERYASLEETRDEAHRRHEVVIQALNQIKTKVEQGNLSLVNEVNQVDQTLKEAVGSLHPLDGHHAIYLEAIRLLKECNGNEIIRTTHFVHDAPYTSQIGTDYLTTLVQTIEQSKKGGRKGIVYHSVLGHNPAIGKDEIPYKVVEEAHDRKAYFKDHHTEHNLDMKWSPYLDLDLFIMDEKYIIIAFPTIQGEPELKCGIRITNRDFVKSVVRWYDEYLSPTAKNIDIK
jgi:hypothetical protein